jgi:hypothetical protein
VATIGWVIDGENKEYLQNFSGESSIKTSTWKTEKQIGELIWLSGK